MHIGAFTDNLNGKIKLLMIVNDDNNFSIKEFETVLKKTLYSINKIHMLEFNQIENVCERNEDALYYEFFGGITLDKDYESDEDYLANRYTAIIVTPSLE